MESTEKIISLVDMLQAEIDNHIQDYENLQEHYQQLMEENDRLKDCIAQLMEDRNVKSEEN